MIDITYCKKCHAYYELDWNEISDGYLSRKNRLLCPINKSFISSDKIPSNCHYKLEQILLKESKK
jgi:hypothetical protein